MFSRGIPWDQVKEGRDESHVVQECHKDVDFHSNDIYEKKFWEVEEVKMN